MESVKLMLSQRLRLTPLFFTAAMVMALVTTATLGLDIMVMLLLDIMAMLVLDTMDMPVSDISDILTTMESVRLSQRLRLTLPFFIALMAMVLDIMAMVWDIMAMLVLDIMAMLVWDILAMLPTMASARLKQLPNTTSSSNNLNETPIQSVNMFQ